MVAPACIGIKDSIFTRMPPLHAMHRPKCPIHAFVSHFVSPAREKTFRQVSYNLLFRLPHVAGVVAATRIVVRLGGSGSIPLGA